MTPVNGTRQARSYTLAATHAPTQLPHAHAQPHEGLAAWSSRLQRSRQSHYLLSTLVYSPWDAITPPPDRVARTTARQSPPRLRTLHRSTTTACSPRQSRASIFRPGRQPHHVTFQQLVAARAVSQPTPHIFSSLVFSRLVLVARISTQAAAVTLRQCSAAHLLPPLARPNPHEHAEGPRACAHSRNWSGGNCWQAHTHPED